MVDKDKLANLLNGGTIRRGQGVRLSTDVGPEGGTSQLVSSNTAAGAIGLDTTTSQKRENTKSHSRNSANSHKRIIAKTHKNGTTISQNHPLKRVNRGYMLREDLIRELKMIAARDGRNLYEVMEEALEKYLKAQTQ